MTHRTALLAATLALPLLLIAGCAPTPPTPAPAPPAGDPGPRAAPEGEPLPEDALLFVAATATADNGAQLSLTAVVHRSLAWSDPAAASRSALMTQVCDGSLEESVYDEQLYSFTQIDVAATPVDGTPAWPEGNRFSLYPYAGNDVVAADGAIVDDEDVDMATPYCVRSKYLPGAGEGTIVLGIAGDTDEVTAAGNFTRWANTFYGFGTTEVQSQTPADTGITLSDCYYTVTDLGAELGGDGETWMQDATDTTCTVGTPFTGAD